MVNFNYLKNLFILDIVCFNNGDKLKGNCSRGLIEFLYFRIFIVYKLIYRVYFLFNFC